MHDLRSKGGDEEMLLYNGPLPPARDLLNAKQAVTAMYDDQHDDPLIAIDDTLDRLNEGCAALAGCCYCCR